MLRGLTLEPLAIGRQDSGDSSTESSPNLLTESGKFRVGAFEIGRDGVTDEVGFGATTSAMGVMGFGADERRSLFGAPAAAHRGSVSRRCRSATAGRLRGPLTRT